MGANVYQAAELNKILAKFGVRLEPLDLVKKRSTKPKPKPK